MSNIQIYRRNLPHIHPYDAIFFITFRLYDTIPQRKLKEFLKRRVIRLKEIKNLSSSVYSIKKYEIEKRFFADYDGWLDKCSTKRSWLEIAGIANIVARKIHSLDTKNYHLIAYCIMPNHVHLLLKLIHKDNINHKKTNTYPLADALRLIKGSTARKCNLILKRNGPFWHHESYDHVVRNEKELNRIIKYILNNPFKAGLAKNRNDWKHIYYNPIFIS